MKKQNSKGWCEHKRGRNLSYGSRLPKRVLKVKLGVAILMDFSGDLVGAGWEGGGSLAQVGNFYFKKNKLINWQMGTCCGERLYETSSRLRELAIFKRNRKKC